MVYLSYGQRKGFPSGVEFQEHEKGRDFMRKWKQWLIAVMAMTAACGTWGCGLKDAAENIADKVINRIEGDDGEENSDKEDSNEEGSDERDSREEENTGEEGSREDGDRAAGAESDDDNRHSRKNIENNGGLVAGCCGDYYYWKYSSDSISSDGVFAGFYPIDNVANELVCRHPDGTESVVLNTPGYGEIFFAGDRIFLKKNYNNGYSVNMDGEERMDYPGMRIWTADEEAGTVIASFAGTEEGYPQGVYVIDSKDGNARQIFSGEGVYADTIDGYSYYSCQDTTSSELVLYQLKIDGTEAPKEIDRISAVDEYGMSNSFVTQITRLGDTLYYSYGYYGGTGGFFQTGGINCVKTDGTEPKVCIEPGIIQGEEFLVEELSEDILLYYNKEYAGSYVGYWDNTLYPDCFVKHMSTGMTEKSLFPLSRQKSFVYLDGAIAEVRENRASYHTVIPADAAASLGCADFDDTTPEIAIIRGLETVGNQVFFTVERSYRDSNFDIGWRSGYRRGPFEFYQMDAGGNQPELLYSY